MRNALQIDALQRFSEVRLLLTHAFSPLKSVALWVMWFSGKTRKEEVDWSVSSSAGVVERVPGKENKVLPKLANGA